MINVSHYKTPCILVFLLLSNFLFRLFFEMHMQPVPFYFDQLQINLNNTAWYTYIIPSNAKVWGGTWASLSIGLLPILNHIFGNTQTYLILNLLFITVAYTLSWYAFNSKIFSFTLGLCLSFTTLNEHVYDNGSLIALYIPLICCFFNLFVLLKLFEEEPPKKIWWLLWGLSLLLYISSFEGWIEYYISIVIIAPFLYYLIAKRRAYSLKSRLIKILTIMTFAFLLFLYIKIKYVYASSPGEEHDLVFNYGRHYWILIIEDLISNFFTFFYTTITTYLPPQLTFSNALIQYGTPTIIELQKGYDLPYVQLVAINSLLLWRFYAGVLISIFCYYFWQVCKRLLTKFNKDYLYLFIFMSMVLISTPAHMVVKYRAMHIVPWLYYQTFIGQIGVILLMSYGLYMLHKSNKPKRFIWTITIMIWSSIIITAFTKHSFFQIGRAYGDVIQYNKCNS